MSGAKSVPALAKRYSTPRAASSRCRAATGAGAGSGIPTGRAAGAGAPDAAADLGAGRGGRAVGGQADLTDDFACRRRVALDRGELLTSGLKGAFFSLPELAFVNIRKGSMAWIGPEVLPGLAGEAAQFGYYDGGLTTTAAGVTTNPGTYPNVLKQTNYLAEAAYYNHAGRFSVFGKFERRMVSGDYSTAVKAASNQTWIAGGVKYYLAPANLMNLILQYERVINNDAPGTQQGGTNNLTLAWQTILY